MAKQPAKSASIEPSAPAVDTAVLVRFTPDMLDAIDDWRRVQKDIPSRAEALRRFAYAALGDTDTVTVEKPRGRKP